MVNASMLYEASLCLLRLWMFKPESKMLPESSVCIVKPLLRDLRRAPHTITLSFSSVLVFLTKEAKTKKPQRNLRNWGSHTGNILPHGYESDAENDSAISANGFTWSNIKVHFKFRLHAGVQLDLFGVLIPRTHHQLSLQVRTQDSKHQNDDSNKVAAKSWTRSRSSHPHKLQWL